MGFQVIEIIRNLLPKTFVLENVKGLVDLHPKTFNDILDALRNIPETRKSRRQMYWVDWRVLNSCYHSGIPQNRPRVYIVGVSKSLTNDNFEFPFPARRPCQPVGKLIKCAHGGSADVETFSLTRLRNYMGILERYREKASAGSQDILIGDMDQGRDALNVGTAG